MYSGLSYYYYALCILGILTEGEDLSALQTLWCRLALSTGCRIVLRLRKTKSIILFSKWLTEMTKIANYEQLIFRVNNKQDVLSGLVG